MVDGCGLKVMQRGCHLLDLDRMMNKDIILCDCFLGCNSLFSSRAKIQSHFENKQFFEWYIFRTHRFLASIMK